MKGNNMNDNSIDIFQALIDELYKSRKLDVKKDFSLMLAAAAAQKEILKHKESKQ